MNIRYFFHSRLVSLTSICYNNLPVFISKPVFVIFVKNE